ncbi:4-amino-4-deoxychorismate synthase [Spizellomyces punctatus DAOM BR117]|uniref:aminodeoxychorismate synthase n=1 Tax=Spizellomyces punctatus (strain DAOM BR117) TaxID=645134 RepID=A0A0L0H4X7_SPIPD|nr:4-amino-4-deoxychorismate synthase [Spizellomyces punctatus DAOM BR117]KNC96262.1 hypothetical protein SPPG_09535 [Spizellomyces punctatus DAOM BR117]|eukprot:XP_016604302.1 hypothetical protein SPPG_09535 [Spizellomyces punctatus DAOM BR117]
MDNIELRTLIVDNYDSYTFNLFQYCCGESGELPVVIRNNQFSWEEVRDKILPHFDCVVISPGPGRPEREGDFGICGRLLKEASIPILGVCLGHQGMATVFGGKVTHAREAIHGRLSPVFHEVKPATQSVGLFDGLPTPFQAVRYHSLIVANNDLPCCLKVTAWTPDPQGEDIIQALEHVDKPIWGVQFHPESICTEGGRSIIGNFRKLAVEILAKRHPIELRPPLPPEVKAVSVIPDALICPNVTDCSISNTEVCVRRLADVYMDTEEVFEHLYSQEDVSFWLDSAKIEQKLSRFSVMGCVSSSLSFCVRYSAKWRTVTVSRPDKQKPGTRPQIAITETVTLKPEESFFTWMSRCLQSRGLGSTRIILEEGEEAPPFNFTCGMVGFFGYEMKEESLQTGGRSFFAELPNTGGPCRNGDVGSLPDSAFIFADQVIVFDHVEKSMYLMGVRDSSADSAKELRDWMDHTIIRLTEIQLSSTLSVQTPSLRTGALLQHSVLSGSTPSSPVMKPTAADKHLRRRSSSAHRSGPALYRLQLAHDRKQYISNIHAALNKITDGETYEVCLTTKISTRIPETSSDPFKMYTHLRKRNPAPYGAFLRFGSGLALASSSPERFLRIEKDGLMSMKPIKGTVPRATKVNGETDEEVREEDERRRRALESDEKNRAENLMIVDLIRNDLNLISEPRSVCVPALMKVETYATVHQLVTTVQGQLRHDLNAVDAVMHSFPPGSMTGAPKLRTVEILESLEGTPRGPYSGVLGYFSLNGAAEFSVVIRTAVFSGNDVSVGAGGAIVALSDPEEEFAEMLLKANSVLPSIMQVYGVGPLDAN